VRKRLFLRIFRYSACCSDSVMTSRMQAACGRVGLPRRRMRMRLARTACSMPVDELVEPAHFSIGGLILIEKRELAFFELVEESVPVDRMELGVRRLEVESQNAGGFFAMLGSFDARGNSAAFLCPLPNGVMIGGCFACHGKISSDLCLAAMPNRNRPRRVPDGTTRPAAAGFNRSPRTQAQPLSAMWPQLTVGGELGPARTAPKTGTPGAARR
jgi:hypothetical protein